MNRIILSTAAALLAVSALAACDTASSSTPESPSVSQGYGSKDASADVVLGPPTQDGVFGGPSVPVTVTNNSSKPSDYSITVAAEVGGVRVDTDNMIFVTNLAPGATAEEKADMWTDDRVTTAATFTVIEVSRTANR